MHKLAAQRLDALANRVQFVERIFREAAWPEGLGQFNFAVTHQAVHELRHKRYALTLHAQVKQLLMPHGSYLVCDHFFGEGGMSNNQLYMTVAEQRQALLSSGYGSVEQACSRVGSSFTMQPNPLELKYPAIRYWFLMNKTPRYRGVFYTAR